MHWTERMNCVIDYVEAHMKSEINENEICNIMACPFSIFQSSFTQITGISFSEYIRRRKLTQGAYDLQNTKAMIICVVLNGMAMLLRILTHLNIRPLHG